MKNLKFTCKTSN